MAEDDEADGGGFDVDDPIGRPPKVFDRIGDEIAVSMAAVADLLAVVVGDRAATA